MNVELRPVVLADYEFLRGLQEAAMRPHAEKTYGVWDADLQRERFKQRFDPAQMQVIVVDGVDAGMLQVEERTEEVFIPAIWLLPAYQGRGIGTRLLRGVIDAAAAQGKPVALRVLKGNMGARSLYQRLGFGVTGETDTHYIMACYPK